MFARQPFFYLIILMRCFVFFPFFVGGGCEPGGGGSGEGAVSAGEAQASGASVGPAEGEKSHFEVGEASPVGLPEVSPVMPPVAGGDRGACGEAALGGCGVWGCCASGACVWLGGDGGGCGDVGASPRGARGRL